MFHTRIAKKIKDIPENDWMRVFPDVPDSYHFFKSIDESHFRQFSFYYISVYDESDTLIGAAPCFLMDYPMDTSLSGPIRHVFGFIRKYRNNFFTIRSVVCGVPMGQGNVGISKQGDKVIRAMCEGMEQIARDKKAHVIAFKDVTRDCARVLDPLLEEGFAKYNSMPSAEMQIDFSDFEGYLKELSHATRYDLRRKFKKVDSRIKLSMEVTNNPAEDALRDIYRLYTGQVKKHDELSFEVVPIDFFKNISKNMPDKARFMVWRMNNKIVAFMFGLLHRDFFSGYYLGLDYSLAYDYHLYFIRFRDAINWMLANGVKRCDMGVTGYEPKKRLGFDFVPLYIYAKHRNRLFRPFFNAMCGRLDFKHYGDPIIREIIKDINEK